MLKKSIKHEFRATARVMLPIYAAILSLAVAAHFSLYVLSHSNRYGSLIRIISGVTTGLFFAVLAASAFGVIALAVLRFYRSFLSDEGYLTMTLPVSTHKLISAKLLASVAWYALSVIVCGLAVLIALLDSSAWGHFFKDFGNFFKAAWETLPTLEPGMVAGLIVCAIEVFLCLVLGAALVSLLIYAATAIGHSFNKHKKLLSVVFGFIFYHATSIAALVSGIFIIGRLFEKYKKAYAMDYLLEPSMTPYILIIGVTLLLLLVACALYYFLTHYFLTKKLNLE